MEPRADVGSRRNGAWLQQGMRAAGMARVYAFRDDRACLSDLFAVEAKAWASKLGISADPHYTIRRADRPAVFDSLAGHFELVEGRVAKSEKTGGRDYLNFGRYFREDFTAVTDTRALALFTADRLDPLHLGGALVRGRALIELRAGPRVDIIHPEQIELLATP